MIKGFQIFLKNPRQQNDCKFKYSYRDKGKRSKNDIKCSHNEMQTEKKKKKKPRNKSTWGNHFNETFGKIRSMKKNNDSKYNIKQMLEIEHLKH